MPFTLNQMLLESASILRGYYDNFWRVFIESPEYGQEINLLVDLLEADMLTPAQLIQSLRELEKSDRPLGEYITRIISAWDMRLHEIDNWGRTALMAIDMNNASEWKGLLEVLSVVLPVTRYEFVSHRNILHAFKFKTAESEEEPQFFSDFWEKLDSLDDPAKTTLLNYKNIFGESLLNNALRNNSAHLPRLIKMVDAIRDSWLIKEYFHINREGNPFVEALEYSPGQIPALLQIMSRLNPQHCFEQLTLRSRTGESVFTRILRLSCPQSLSELILILKKLSSLQKQILFQDRELFENGELLIQQIIASGESGLNAFLSYIADDEEIPEPFLAQLAHYLPTPAVHANLNAWLLIVSRLNPVKRNGFFNNDEMTFLANRIKECPDYASIIKASDAKGNTLLMRAASQSSSPDALAYLLGLMDVIYRDDPANKAELLLALNVQGECAAGIASSANHECAGMIREATVNVTKNLVIDYRSGLTLFQPSSDASEQLRSARVSNLPC